MHVSQSFLQRISGAVLSLLPIPRAIDGPETTRIEACRMCGCERGKLVAQVHFWDIKESDLIWCESCGLIQFDPMLTEEDTALGCQRKLPLAVDMLKVELSGAK